MQASPVAALSREKLEKMFTDSIRKLKSKERLVENLTAERDELAAKVRGGEGATDDAHAELNSQLKAFLFHLLPPPLPAGPEHLWTEDWRGVAIESRKLVVWRRKAPRKLYES